MRPLGVCKTERGYLIAARVITFLMGVMGTLFGLIFVDPEIKSLFDAFIKVIGLFMGVLGGLFVLGVLTRRANATGALTGAFVGAAVMFALWRFTDVNGYLYTVSGITTCVLTGYLASLIRGGQNRDLRGLTVFSSRVTPASRPQRKSALVFAPMFVPSAGPDGRTAFPVRIREYREPRGRLSPLSPPLSPARPAPLSPLSLATPVCQR